MGLMEGHVEHAMQSPADVMLTVKKRVTRQGMQLSS